MNTDDEEDVVMSSPPQEQFNIRSNDRQFSCEPHCNPPPDGFGGASASAAFFSSSSSSSSQMNNITFTTQYLDIDSLHKHIIEISTSLTNSINDYKQWLKDKEAEIETRYMMNQIEATLSLFNRVNNVRSKLQQSNKILNSWQVMIQDKLWDIIENIRSYEKVKNRLDGYKNAGMIESSYGGDIGLSANRNDQARRKITHTKGINRSLNKIKNIESELNNNLIEFYSEINSFNSGTIRVKNKMLDLVSLGKDIDSLVQDESPLSRVQNDLANIINASDVQVRLTTENSAETIFNAMQVRNPIDVDLRDPASLFSTDELVVHLNTIKNNKLYTPNAVVSIEKILEYATKAAPNDPRIKTLAIDIRNNTPDKVFRDLRRNMRDQDTIYVRLGKIESLIRNLDKNDRPTYNDGLEALLLETREVARAFLEKDD